MVGACQAALRLAAAGLARLVRPVGALALLVLALAAGPAAAGDGIPGARIWLEIERHDRPPFVQEMVLVRVRGAFTVPIALQKLEPPDLAGFRVLPIGKDYWGEVDDDGRQALGMVRSFALFPQRSGELTIGSFVHRLTIVGASGGRETVDLATDPATLTVAPAPVAEGAWWLPASALTVTDSWSVAPEALAIGQSTRRTVTIEAAGVTDDQLPPAPTLRTPKLIAFAAAPERETVVAVTPPPTSREARRQSLAKPGRYREILAPDGVRAKVVYAWEIRPTTDEAVDLPAVEIPWFDTAAGLMRTAVIPARTVSVAPLGPSLDDMERALGIVGPPEPPRGGGLADLAFAALVFLASFAATVTAVRRPPGGGRGRSWLPARGGRPARPASETGRRPR